MSLLAGLKDRAQRFRQQSLTLYLVARHPGTPWYAKAVAAGTAAYAFSPIDLIPDFVPVLGYLDDLVLIPLGIAVAVRLVPAAVMDECRVAAAEAFRDGMPVSKAAGVAVVTVWVVLVGFAAAIAWRALGG